MPRRITLMLAITFAAGLLFVNLYTSLVDAPNWGHAIPSSIQAARDYFKAANPGTFFRIFSPANQVLALLALILCWKADRKARMYCIIGLLAAVAGDAFTFGYFYPRNHIMFDLPIEANLDAIRKAWSEWSAMNWLRSLIIAVGLYSEFAALTLVIKHAIPNTRDMVTKASL